ncbi:hypothetical protein CLM85_02470, partial [Streptomyces albidoflavus]|uniref:hypothetical protein n=1 Tax=Streptomyces albidoflavus TaxID=1886 RepID=UPI000BD9EDEB
MTCLTGGGCRWEGGQGLVRSGHDAGARAVDGGDGSRSCVVGPVLLGLAGGDLDGHHAAEAEQYLTPHAGAVAVAAVPGAPLSAVLAGTPE